MRTVSIPDKLARVIDQLVSGKSLEAKIGQVVESELRRRLARYELTNRLFQKKYGMTLAEFEANEIVKKLGYSFEVESDHQDWDLAVGGIEALRRELAELQVKP